MRVLVLSLILVAAACGSSTENGTDPDGADTSIAAAADAAEATERLEQIATEVDAWAAASTIEEAEGHAEAAANLVVGPGGLGYGDRDGDGEIAGDVPEGLLPGPDGIPEGIVLDSIGAAECVNRDVLGGDWDDPVARWAVLAEAIDQWAPDNNTFPSLPSHPMRIVGWATLTQSGSFEEAIEYSGHADLHVDVTRDALARC
jgi:hypothetical protein